MKKYALSLMLMVTGLFAIAQEQDVFDIAISSKDHTTLVAAVEAADLVETLKGEGPFTIFAPTNAAFEKLPEGSVERFLKPENKAHLSTILTYHVISGNFDAAAVVNAIKESDGKITLTTLHGGMLRLSLEGENILILAETGTKATVTTADLEGSNGVIHVIDAVLFPN